jgi:hypothetical protein
MSRVSDAVRGRGAAQGRGRPARGRAPLVVVLARLLGHALVPDTCRAAVRARAGGRGDARRATFASTRTRTGVIGVRREQRGDPGRADDDHEGRAASQPSSAADQRLRNGRSRGDPAGLREDGVRRRHRPGRSEPCAREPFDRIDPRADARRLLCGAPQARPRLRHRLARTTRARRRVAERRARTRDCLPGSTVVPVRLLEPVEPRPDAGRVATAAGAAARGRERRRDRVGADRPLDGLRDRPRGVGDRLDAGTAAVAGGRGARGMPVQVAAVVAALLGILLGKYLSYAWALQDVAGRASRSGCSPSRHGHSSARTSATSSAGST